MDAAVLVKGSRRAEPQLWRSRSVLAWVVYDALQRGPEPPAGRGPVPVWAC